VALWSARGRLPADTDPRAPVTLRHWPNMTQLLTVAPFLRIAALWSRRPLSIEQTAQTLAIEDRYVCAFYSGCHCLGLVQTEFTDTAQHPVVPMNNAGERQGLLRRILNHLRVA